MKRAYLEDHEFDEDAMPCPCEVCGGWFDLSDGAGHPREPKIVICEGCAYDIQKEVDKEEEIEELKNQISDAEYTIKDCNEQLARLIPAQEEAKEFSWLVKTNDVIIAARETLFEDSGSAIKGIVITTGTGEIAFTKYELQRIIDQLDNP